MVDEKERIQKLILNMAKGNEQSRKFIYDPVNKTVRPVSKFTDPDGAMKMTPEDFRFSAESVNHRGMIVLPMALLERLDKSKDRHEVLFAGRKDECVYTLLRATHSKASFPGSIILVRNRVMNELSSIPGKPDDWVRVVMSYSSNEATDPGSENGVRIDGYVRQQKEWKDATVQIVPVKDEIFSRHGGLLETDVISGKKAFIVGLGSVGSQISLELSKAGITHLSVMDHDRLEVANTSRHCGGLSDVGRLKANVMADMILDRNPYAEVCVLTERVSWDNIEDIRERVKQSDIVICAADEMKARLILNRLCVEEETACIFAGAFRRAYGVQIIFVHPNKSPCYQCFLMSIPEQNREIEISNRAQAERYAYSDRPVEIEPGLSNDIAPLGTMVVKLAIQELLKGSDTSFRSLDDDLVAPWYIWLNRRERETPYEKLNPLEFNVDGMAVLRWYGIDLRRHSACPVCGDFEGQVTEQ